jgi:RHS repeat-associated protein
MMNNKIYNKFGHCTSIDYGHGTYATCAYDNYQRLAYLIYTTSNEPMNLSYSYDATSRITCSRFGARYYDSDLSIWLSVDPRASSYPGLTPYNYCANSPVMYTDPNGESLKWWQGLLIGLGVDIATGGILTATGFTITTTASAVAFGASTTLSSVDFGVSFVRSIVTGNDQSMQNWFNMEVGRLTSFTSMFSYDKTATGFEWPLQVFNNLTGGEFLQDQVGNTFGHALNIGGKITASGFYDHRLILRTPKNTLNTAISFGHYIYGDNIALSPNDYSQGTDGLDLLAHEYGHTYQSRIMGPMYLFRVGLPSVINNNNLSEKDATRRGSSNLGITIQDERKFPSGTSTYKWYEFFGTPVVWPFMWMWNLNEY